MSKKNVVAGLGEIGNPIFKILSKSVICIGYDTNTSLINKKHFSKYESCLTSFLHVCIPFNDSFVKNVLSLTKKFNPECVVIHSTVSPNTKKLLQIKNGHLLNTQNF
jgi:hypothetical protein